MGGIDNVTWSQLAQWQRSFGSKAAIALPIFGFVVATVPDDLFPTLLSRNWKVHVVFWGAMVFLAGHLVIWIRRPIEFARNTDVHQDIAEARQFATHDDFAEKVRMLALSVDRIAAAKVLDDGTLAIARARLSAAQTATTTNWRPHLAAVIIDQRKLRELDDRPGRRSAVVLLGIGTAMMALPTVFNVLTAAAALLEGYLAHVS